MSHDCNFVARAWRPFRPFTDRDACASMWARLRGAFPRVLACVLMPNHIHLTLRTASPADARHRLSVELRAFTRQFHPGKRLWEPVPEVELIDTDLSLQRVVRYNHLNPSRADLVHDPLEWEWSTHRDLVGATTDDWIDRARLSTAFRCAKSELGRKLHQYTSNDTKVVIGGTPFPLAPDPGRGLCANLDAVLSAVLQASRAPEGAIRERSAVRALVVQAAGALGLCHSPELAARVELSRKSTGRILATPVPRESLNAIALILNDPRMLRALTVPRLAQKSQRPRMSPTRPFKGADLESNLSTNPNRDTHPR